MPQRTLETEIDLEAGTAVKVGQKLAVLTEQ
jgi:hypothetical protein